MVFDKCVFVFFVDKFEGMNVEILYYMIGLRNSFVGGDLLLYVSSLLMKRDKVLSIIVCSLGLRYFIVRFGFKGVNNIREFDSILRRCK